MAILAKFNSTNDVLPCIPRAFIYQQSSGKIIWHFPKKRLSLNHTPKQAMRGCLQGLKVQEVTARQSEDHKETTSSSLLSLPQARCLVEFLGWANSLGNKSGPVGRRSFQIGNGPPTTMLPLVGILSTLTTWAQFGQVQYLHGRPPTNSEHTVVAAEYGVSNSAGKYSSVWIGIDPMPQHGVRGPW